MQNEVAQMEQKPKSIINVKIQVVDSHFLVSFKYGENEIYHDLVDVLAKITKKVEELEEKK